MIGLLGWTVLMAAIVGDEPPPIVVRIGLNSGSEVNVSEVVERLARATGLTVDRPSGPLNLPMSGLAAPMTRALLGETLGRDASLEVRPHELVITVSGRVTGPDGRDEWAGRLRALSDRANQEIGRRSRYGMRSRPSYRPNDPARPTVCLVHGLNSTSNVFVHMFGPLEEAGYGVVVYDFPYNRDLDESSAAFARDWAEFRRQRGETRPWTILAHSMGSLLARSYVEDDSAFARDVSSLILIAPPNRGSSLARAQTFLQMVQGLQAIHGSRRTDPLALLGDGMGAAADDMTPGSAYLRDLDRRKRRAGVTYHTLAGDVGYLNPRARQQVEARGNGRGLLGGIGGRRTSRGC